MKFTTKTIATIGVTAALYVVLTVGLAPISYGAVQFRLSEVMNLLAFINPVFAPGMIIGCFIANMFSPLGIMDLLFGTLSTVFSMVCIPKSKHLFVATLFPTISSVFIGFEIVLLNHFEITNFSQLFNSLKGIFTVGSGVFIEFLSITLTVAIGQFVVVTIIGYPLFKLLMKNKKLMEILKLK